MRPFSRLLRRLLRRLPSRDGTYLSVALLIAFSQEMTPLAVTAAISDAASLSLKRCHRFTGSFVGVLVTFTSQEKPFSLSRDAAALLLAFRTLGRRRCVLTLSLLKK
jgi:hypothetical protein